MERYDRYFTHFGHKPCKNSYNNVSCYPSATQTKKVEDLARLSIKGKPVYVGVDDNKDAATVVGLEQGYVVCPADKRFLLLFTFLKKNMKKKVRRSSGRSVERNCVR